ncbi:MAG: FadR/GntR family transcriptional regulator [Bacteroidota bacterium]
MKLVDEAQHKIREMILNKEFDHNGYLPSEGELCKRFGISRVTVREAVRSMEVRGFLKRVHGKGIMVVDNSIKVMSRSIGDMMSLGDFGIDELLEVRKIIEIQTASLAAKRATQKDMEALRNALENMENAAVMDEKYLNSDLDFHLILVQAAKNHLLSAIVSAYTPLLKKLIVESSQIDYVIEKKHHYHRNVYECIIKGDDEGASVCMRIHLNATFENLRNQSK